MRKIIVITVVAAFTEVAAAGAFDAPPSQQDDRGVRIAWRISFGGAPATPPQPALAWAGQSQLPPPPTSPPPPTTPTPTTGEVVAIPMDPPPPPPEEEGYFSQITGVQWLGIGIAAIALGAVLADSGGGDDPEPAPIGSGGG